MSPVAQFPQQTFKCGHRQESWRSPAECHKLRCQNCIDKPKAKKTAKTPEEVKE